MHLAGQLGIVERRLVNFRCAGGRRIGTDRRANDFRRQSLYGRRIPDAAIDGTHRDSVTAVRANAVKLGIDRLIVHGERTGFSVAVVVDYRGAPALGFCRVVGFVPDARLEPAEAAPAQGKVDGSVLVIREGCVALARSRCRQTQICRSWDRRYRRPIRGAFPMASARALRPVRQSMLILGIGGVRRIPGFPRLRILVAGTGLAEIRRFRLAILHADPQPAAVIHLRVLGIDDVVFQTICFPSREMAPSTAAATRWACTFCRPHCAAEF